MFESNYLTMLTKPTYEKPVDTSQDVVERGLTIVLGPGSESVVESMKNSPSAVDRALAEQSFVTKVIFCVTEKFPF